MDEPSFPPNMPPATQASDDPNDDHLATSPSVECSSSSSAWLTPQSTESREDERLSAAFRRAQAKHSEWLSNSTLEAKVAWKEAEVGVKSEVVRLSQCGPGGMYQVGDSDADVVFVPEVPTKAEVELTKAKVELTKAEVELAKAKWEKNGRGEDSIFYTMFETAVLAHKTAVLAHKTAVLAHKTAVATADGSAESQDEDRIRFTRVTASASTQGKDSVPFNKHYEFSPVSEPTSLIPLLMAGVLVSRGMEEQGAGQAADDQGVTGASDDQTHTNEERVLPALVRTAVDLKNRELVQATEHLQTLTESLLFSSESERAVGVNGPHMGNRNKENAFCNRLDMALRVTLPNRELTLDRFVNQTELGPSMIKMRDMLYANLGWIESRVASSSQAPDSHGEASSSQDEASSSQGGAVATQSYPNASPRRKSNRSAGMNSPLQSTYCHKCSLFRGQQVDFAFGAMYERSLLAFSFFEPGTKEKTGQAWAYARSLALSMFGAPVGVAFHGLYGNFLQPDKSGAKLSLSLCAYLTVGSTQKDTETGLIPIRIGELDFGSGQGGYDWVGYQECVMAFALASIQTTGEMLRRIARPNTQPRLYGKNVSSTASGYVYKWFLGSTSGRKANEDLWERFSPELLVDVLVVNKGNFVFDNGGTVKEGAVAVLVTRFVEDVEGGANAGAGNPVTVGHFMDVAATLAKMHSEGYVYGDIRRYNMVFGADGKGHIIDYDYAGELEVARYPDRFTHDILDGKRHRDARGGQPMQSAHDIFALASVMALYMPAEVDLRTQWSILCGQGSGWNLEFGESMQRGTVLVPAPNSRTGAERPMNGPMSKWERGNGSPSAADETAEE